MSIISYLNPLSYLPILNPIGRIQAAEHVKSSHQAEGVILASRAVYVEGELNRARSDLKKDIFGVGVGATLAFGAAAVLFGTPAGLVIIAGLGLTKLTTIAAIIPIAYTAARYIINPLVGNLLKPNPK